jgi:peptidyl-prolyl cis-trans isomerase C
MEPGTDQPAGPCGGFSTQEAVLRKLALFFGLILLFAVFAGCGKKGAGDQATAFPDSIVDSEVIVTVNDYPVTGRELRLFSAVFLQSNRQNLPPRVYNEQVLDKLIDRILIWREAVANNITVDDSTSNETIAEFLQAMGGESMVQNFLQRMNFQRDELMASLKKDLVIRALLEERFTKDIDVTDEQAREYFDSNQEQFIMPDSVRARHILIRFKPGDTEQTKQEKRKKIEKLLERAKAGEDFATLARENSEDPAASRGGDLGMFARGAMVASFDSAAFALDKGQISGIVETPYGYHLIKLEQKKAGGSLKFDDIKEDLKSKMWEFELGNLIQNHLQDLRKTARIERHYKSAA